MSNSLSHETSRQLSPISIILFILLHAFLLFVVFAIGRQALVATFGVPGELDGRGREIWAMWYLALRYDLRTIIVCLIPFYLIGIASCFYGGVASVFSWLQKLFSPIIYLIASLATVTNFFYYKTFLKEIDVMIFNLKDDDTSAILSSIISDYPFFRIMLLVIGVTLLFTWFTHLLWRVCRCFSCNKLFQPATEGDRKTSIFAKFGFYSHLIKIGILLPFLLLTFIGARGTLRSIPLRQQERFVAKIQILNDAVPNALIALNWAWDNYQDNPPYIPVSEEEGHELLQKALGGDSLTKMTPENPYLAKNKPHVVLAVMEGMGTNLLEFDRPGVLDVLGSFRSHMEEDFVFKKFLAENSRTMYALMRLFFCCPDADITKGVSKMTRLDNSAYDVYRQNGYETVFIHAGLPSWWEMRSFLARQDVDRTFFSDDFLERYADAEMVLVSGSWGLPDEYAFRLAFELLEKSTKPMFITIMTLSNHTPFKVPIKDMDRFPVKPDKNTLSYFFDDEEKVGRILNSYQYANNCVGDFITAVKQDAHLVNNTIIGVTGDHASVKLKPKGNSDVLFLNKASPFYLYVPKPILKHTKHVYVPDRIGSHKDILPTLFELSLSGSPYYTVGGRNMIAVEDYPALAAGYCFNLFMGVSLFMDANGVCSKGKNLNTYYGWREGLSLEPNPIAPPAEVIEKLNSYEKLYRWQINARVAGLK